MSAGQLLLPLRSALRSDERWDVPPADVRELAVREAERLKVAQICRDLDAPDIAEKLGLTNV